MTARHLTRADRPRAARVLIVYSRATGERRRVIDADRDREYAHHESRLHPGEAALYLGHAEYDALAGPAALDDLVARRAGFARAPDRAASRHALIDPGGAVVNAIHADPSCGDSGAHFGPGFTIAPHAEAHVGWTWRDGAFHPPETAK